MRRKLMGLRPAHDALNRELKFDDGKPNCAVTRRRARRRSGAISRTQLRGNGRYRRRPLAVHLCDKRGRRARQTLFLRPRRDGGFERAIRRRLQNIVAARTNIELLRAIDDPAQVALDDVLRDIASPAATPPAEMDASKTTAWDAIVAGKSINVVVGPPGVGRTFLISNLVKSILDNTKDARVLISAQNHETQRTVVEHGAPGLVDEGDPAVRFHQEDSRPAADWPATSGERTRIHWQMFREIELRVVRIVLEKMQRHRADRAWPRSRRRRNRRVPARVSTMPDSAPRRRYSRSALKASRLRTSRPIRCLERAFQAFAPNRHNLARRP